MTDMGTDVPASPMDSFGVGIFMISLVISMPVDLEHGIGEITWDIQGSPLICLGLRVSLWAILVLL